MRFAMSSLVSTFHDAADSPEAWPQALKALTDAAEAAGAALIILNKSTGNVDEKTFRMSSGPAVTEERVVHHCVIIGVHQQIGRSFSDKVDSTVGLVAIPLKQAARRHIERFYSLRTGIFDESPAGVLAEGSRFYFHVDNSSRYPDETGSVFSTPDDARAHAFVIAQELGHDESWHGSSVLVTDHWGQEITRVLVGR
jgi:hypothetical protein